MTWGVAAEQRFIVREKEGGGALLWRSAPTHLPCRSVLEQDTEPHLKPMETLHHARWHQHFQWQHLQEQYVSWCCPRCWWNTNHTWCIVYRMCDITTWLCRRCVPGKISACARACCTQLPRRRRSRLSPWRRCSTGCCGTGVPGIRTPTPVSGGSWEQSCQPCPRFRVCLSVAVTQALQYSGIHQKKRKEGFIQTPVCVPLVPPGFHQSRESAEIGHFFFCVSCELPVSLCDQMKPPFSLLHTQLSKMSSSL